MSLPVDPGDKSSQTFLCKNLIPSEFAAYTATLPSFDMETIRADFPIL